MTKPKYTDPWDDLTIDPEDIKYGDYESELADGFHVEAFDNPEWEEDDDA